MSSPPAPALPRFRLDVFEGPLDLLLHLIKKNEVEIYDIPIATITEQYLSYLQFLEELNLDLAGEYLVMAATLMQIKSRMLLPKEEGEEDEEDEDPRAELVAQLEEYRRFREAAAHLADRDVLERDVFRRPPERPEEGGGPPPLREMTIGDLVDALREVLKRLPSDAEHEVVHKRVAIRDVMRSIVDRLRGGDVAFGDLFEEATTRREMVTAFLALLELVKRRLVRALQAERFGPIQLSLAVPRDAEVSVSVEDEYKG